MPWFKVDDGFYNHPKVIGLDMAARGLWVSAGSYCAAYLTDGVITDRQIRAIGGTRKQAEKLVSAGLWSVDDASPRARRYFFNDWRDFQPTRDDVLSKRQEDADRKREARARKATYRENEKMSARTNDGRPAGVRSTSVRAPSALPDPARPDLKERGEKEIATRPVGSGGIDSPPLVSDERGGGAAATSGGFAAYGSPDDPRCVKHKDLPRDQVPACRDCARAREFFEARDRDARRARQIAIQECQWCDENGMAWPVNANGDTVAVRCDHVRVPVAPPPPPPFQSWRSKK